MRTAGDRKLDCIHKDAADNFCGVFLVYVSVEKMHDETKR